MLFTCTANDSKKRYSPNDFTGGGVEEVSVVFLESTIAKGQSKVTIEMSFSDNREGRKWSVGKTYELPVTG